MKKLFISLLITVVCSEAAKTVKHEISNGETLYTIAHKNHTTIEEVRKMNGLKKGDILKIGRVLTVPTNTYFPNKKKVKALKTKKLRSYVIKYGDTLFTIARKHGMTISELLNVNDITYTSKLKVGQVVNVGEGTSVKNIIKLAKTKLGRKYVWGAVGKRGTFDCSGFTNYVFKKNGINIPRTSLNQSKYGKPVTRKNLQRGDLVFFDTSKKRKGYVNHVGIYLGNGKFIHASSAKKKVVVSTLSKFYAKRYKGARRPS